MRTFLVFALFLSFSIVGPVFAADPETTPRAARHGMENLIYWKTVARFFSCQPDSEAVRRLAHR